jgi:hypothetical protein
MAAGELEQVTHGFADESVIAHLVGGEAFGFGEHGHGRCRAA